MTDDGEPVMAESPVRLADLMVLIDQLQKANAALQTRVSELEQNQKHLTKLVRTLEVTQEVFSQTHGRKKSSDSMKIKTIGPPAIAEDVTAPSPTVESFAQVRENHMTRSGTIQNLLEELAKEATTQTIHTWAEMNASRVDIKAMSKTELARQEAIHTLITSEELIVRDLTILRDIHMKKFKESNLLTNDQFGIIFSNLVQVLSVTRNFFEVLTDKQKATLTFGHISECFSQMNIFLKAYGTYCQSHPSSTLTLTQVRKNEKIRFLLAFLTNDIPLAHQASLEAFLMKPIQRVASYPALFGEILKHTDKDSPDFSALTQLKEKFELLLFQAFRATPKFDEAQKVLLAQAIIDSDKPLQLLSSKRSFVYEGVVQKHDLLGKKDLFLVLFSDLLLICRPNGHSKVHFRLKESVPADLFMALDAEETEHKPVFQLHFPGKDKLTIECPSMEEKINWIRMFAELNSSQNVRSVEDKGTKKKSGLKLWASSFANQAEGIEDSEKHKETVGSSIIKRSKTLTQRVSTADAFASLIRRKKTTTENEVPKAADSHISLTDDNVKNPAKDAPKDWQPPTSNGLRQLDATNQQRKRLSTVLFDPTHPLPELPHPKTVNNNIEDLYVASEAFVARTAFEVSFDVGAEILVVNSDREDYWKVEMKGIFGYAPSSFLEPSSLENYDLVEAINKLKFERSVGCRTCQADPRNTVAEETEVSQPPPLEQRRPSEKSQSHSGESHPEAHAVPAMIEPVAEKDKEKKKKKTSKGDDAKPEKEKKKKDDKDKEKRKSSKGSGDEGGRVKLKKKMSQSPSMGDIAEQNAPNPLEIIAEQPEEKREEKPEEKPVENLEEKPEEKQEETNPEQHEDKHEEIEEKREEQHEEKHEEKEEEKEKPEEKQEEKQEEPAQSPPAQMEPASTRIESMDVEAEFFDAQDDIVSSHKDD